MYFYFTLPPPSKYTYLYMNAYMYAIYINAPLTNETHNSHILHTLTYCTSLFNNRFNSSTTYLIGIWFNVRPTFSLFGLPNVESAP